jgi:hypothetical protein
MDNEVYDIYINETSPRAKQPDKIITSLKPHQQAGLYKAYKMEQNGCLKYKLKTSPITNTMNMNEIEEKNVSIKFKSNIGILGEMVGYGKTLTALSIVAMSDINTIHKNSEMNTSYCNPDNYSYVSSSRKNRNILEENVIRSTLIIVPRGPVYVQWEKSIKEMTKLKYLAIENLNFIKKYLPSDSSSVTDIVNFFNQYDIVLIKNTTVELLFTRYRQIIPNDKMPLLSIIKRWKRVMIDEAHELIHSVPLLYYEYLWLITGTYYSLLYRIKSYRSILYNIRECINYDTIDLLTIKGERDFVRNSFKIPEPNEHKYICKMPTQMNIIKGFVCKNILDKINANDIEGAIRELGGKVDTQTNVIELVSNELQREIKNKEKEKEYIESLDIPSDNKRLRIDSIQNEINAKNAKLIDLQNRINDIENKMCSICMYDIENPLILECTHSYCASCIVQWLEKSLKCPECRNEINTEKIISITNKKTEIEEKPKMMNKLETLINIVKNKTDGKFIVFSQYDNSFIDVKEVLYKNNISFSEMKGNTNHMMNILNNFKDGKLQVILLNTNFAGSGIDISFATDVIIYHMMGPAKHQAIGRAQRVGRNDVLNIHYLCYEHEIENI